MKRITLWIVITLCLTACEHETDNSVPPKVKYRDMNSWFGNPKHDNRCEADIFYIYPSLFFAKPNAEGDTLLYSDIHNSEQALRIAEIQQQYKTIYADSTFNFYSPKYRQIMLDVYGRGEEVVNEMMSVPTEDIVNAFQYYMKHFNGGRPYFLMGHSQGASLIIEMIKKSMTQKQYDLMIAAYVFGSKLTKEEVEECPYLTPATGEDDLHCIIVFNSVTDTSVRTPSYFKSDYAINPVNWKTDSTFAPKEMQKGAVLYSQKDTTCYFIAKYTGTYLHDNYLVCPDVEPSFFYIESMADICPRGCLHLGDPLMFGKDIKDNMHIRFNKYKSSAK